MHTTLRTIRRLLNAAIIAAGVAIPAIVLAAPKAAATSGATPLANPLAVCGSAVGSKCVQLIIGSVIRTALGISGSIALLIVIYGGFLWLTSAGNSERIQKGKTMLIWASIGIAVIFGAYAITSTILGALTTGGGSGSGAPEGGSSSSGCFQNSDCASGEVCLSDASCGPAPAAGTPEVGTGNPGEACPCKAGLECVTSANICRIPGGCGIGPACRADQTCNGGKCQGGAGSTCLDSTECRSGFHCSDVPGECVAN
jgi:hypothetical protein